jgi:hypothetical protein
MRIRSFVFAATVATAGMVGLAPAANASGCSCPPGGVEQDVPAGDIFDKNGDGVICTKDIPGAGEGNSANSQRGTGQNGFHTDGHNHKDNGPH